MFIYFKFKFQPYTLRISVLSVLKELITNILNNDELDHDEQIIRDNYIGVLKDHLFDNNAFVRSKVGVFN